MQSVNQLFTEKYRPKNLEELILPDRVMSKFKDGLVQIRQDGVLLQEVPDTIANLFDKEIRKTII